MLRLKRLRQRGAEDKKNGSVETEKASPAKKCKRSVANIRINKDLTQFALPDTCKVDFPDHNDLSNFNLIVSPKEGYYKNGRFVFAFNVGEEYPYEPPKVKCLTDVYHPNIDHKGNICLNILREEWNPILNIGSVVLGIQLLFLEPNANDPLNVEAGEMLRKDEERFQSNARTCVYGGYVGNKYFEGCAASRWL